MPVPFRFDIARASETHAFNPDLVSGDEEALRALKPAVFGALFARSYSKLPVKHARLVWECAVDTAPPATIRPRKPKVWFVCTTNMSKGTSYLVE